MNDYNATARAITITGTKFRDSIGLYTVADNSNGVNPDRSADALNDNRISRSVMHYTPTRIFIEKARMLMKLLMRLLKAISMHLMIISKLILTILQTCSQPGLAQVITAGIFLQLRSRMVGAAVGGYVIYK